MPDWFYANGGTPSGPHADGEMEQLVGTGRLSADTLCWTPEYGDTWRPLSQTAFYVGGASSATPTNTSALSIAAPVQASAARAPVTDVYVWIFAVMPVITVALQFTIGALGFAPVWMANAISYGAIGIYAGLAVVDAQQVNRQAPLRDGRKLSALWFLIAPVYLWRRATILGRPRTNFWVMIACIGVALAATLAAVEYMGAATALPVELWPNLGDGGLRKAAYRGG